MNDPVKKKYVPPTVGPLQSLAVYASYCGGGSAVVCNSGAVAPGGCTTGSSASGGDVCSGGPSPFAALDCMEGPTPDPG